MINKTTELEYAKAKVNILLAVNIEKRCKEKFGNTTAEVLNSIYTNGAYDFTVSELISLCLTLECSLKDLFDFS
jgi:DNA-binding Xre family transcriptional regulator